MNALSERLTPGAGYNDSILVTRYITTPNQRVSSPILCISFTRLNPTWRILSFSLGQKRGNEDSNGLVEWIESTSSGDKKQFVRVGWLITGE